jgi:hypothetical protein
MSGGKFQKTVMQLIVYAMLPTCSCVFNMQTQRNEPLFQNRNPSIKSNPKWILRDQSIVIRVYIIIKPISLLVDLFLVLSEGVITRLSLSDGTNHK